MNHDDAIHVLIEDRIRQNPDLLSAINQATEFISVQATDVPPPSEVKWSFADRDGKTVSLLMADKHTGTGPAVKHNFWTRWILDKVSREICVLKTWGDLLGRRSDLQMATINKLISQLEEGKNGDDES